MEAEEYRPLREIAARQRAVVLGAVAGQKSISIPGWN